MTFRSEKDSLGNRDVSEKAYYGIQTRRAIENFPISNMRARPSFIYATVQIKKAAAIVHKNLGLLDKKKGKAIIAACDEILAGDHLQWFVVDVYQAGAGTSHHMNTNEVIANRALELLGHSKGQYRHLHPNDDVNMAQSTNDVIPTAMRIAAVMESTALLDNLENLANTFKEKAFEFDSIIKSARTHLQDAVPMRLGQEFGAYATNMIKHHEAITTLLAPCYELGLGGTAAGTGLNAHPQYRSKIAEQLSEQTKIRFTSAADMFEAMQSMRPFVGLSGAIRNLAQDLTRIANDLRLLSSGPKTGLAEINLPPVQPGSSIMPGKVNPVMAEMLNMICFQVMGYDTTILMAAQAGQLELNVMMPVIAYNLLFEIEILSNGIYAFNERCIRGITANKDRCKAFAEGSMSIVTAMNPHIGYAKAAEVAKAYLESDQSIREIILEMKLLRPEQLDEVMDLYEMTVPPE
jgi:aspartate ammonia-lyase